MWRGWYSCHILNLSTLAPHKRWQRSRSPHIPQRERERGEGEQIKQYRGYKNKIRKIWHKKRGGSEWSKPLKRGKDKKVRQEEQGDCEEGRASGKKGFIGRWILAKPQLIPPDNAWQTNSYCVNLACNPPSQLTVQCLDLVQSERPGKPDRSGDGEGLRDWNGGGNQGPAWMARVGL